jgi:hypothetical protein
MSQTQAVIIAPMTKILLDSLSALQQLPPAAIVDRALITYRDSLCDADRTALGTFYGRAIHNREALLAEATKKTATTGQPVAIYESTRFCFKRHVIDRLGMDDEFRMITPVGVFQMSKAAFFREFPNVLASESYKAGVYNYPRLPSKAEGFRVHSG